MHYQAVKQEVVQWSSPLAPLFVVLWTLEVIKEKQSKKFQVQSQKWDGAAKGSRSYLNYVYASFPSIPLIYISRNLFIYRICTFLKLPPPHYVCHLSMAPKAINVAAKVEMAFLATTLWLKWLRHVKMETLHGVANRKGGGETPMLAEIQFQAAVSLPVDILKVLQSREIS